MPPRLAETIVDFFDAFAPEYDAWSGGIHRKVAARVVQMAVATPQAPTPSTPPAATATAPRGKKPPRTRHALDVATGTGLVANGLAAALGRGTQVVGVDVSEGMLRVARAAPPPAATFVGMAAEHLIYRDASFDLVTISDALAYFADPEAALAEAARVLRPGGRLVLACARRSLGTQAQDDFFAVIESFLRRYPLNIPRHDDERRHLGEPSVLTELLADFGFAGFEVGTLVTGWTLRGGSEWLRLMRGAGPFTHAAAEALGPTLRARLVREIDEALAPLGDEGERSHFGYTLVAARRG